MAAKSKVKKTAAKAKSSAKKPAAKAHKYVYAWGAGKADGHGGMKPLLGGKGANLAEMTRIGLPVPPGFTAMMSAPCSAAARACTTSSWMLPVATIR